MLNNNLAHSFSLAFSHFPKIGKHSNDRQAVSYICSNTRKL